jgi:hypothetical protein
MSSLHLSEEHPVFVADNNALDAVMIQSYFCAMAIGKCSVSDRELQVVRD